MIAEKEVTSPPSKESTKENRSPEKTLLNSDSSQNELDVSGSDFTPRSKTKISSFRQQGVLNFELGHKATIRKKPTEDGHTHDWTVFLRFVEDCPLKDCVEKVVFKLHDTFQNPERVIKDPPFEIFETGYGGFDLPIYIHLRKDCKPKISTFIYDLYLVANKPTFNLRREKIVIKNAAPPLKNKLHLSSAGNLGKISKARKLLQKAKGAKALSPKSPKKLTINNSLNKKATIDKNVPKLNLRQAPNVSARKGIKTTKHLKGNKSVGKENKGRENTPKKQTAEKNEECAAKAETLGSGLRRSSRQSAVQAIMKLTHAVNDDTEASSEGPTPRKSKRRPIEDSDVDSPATPKRGRKRERGASEKSPKTKKVRKLAPIFGKQKKDETESDSDLEIIELTEEEKERQRIRQAFLMSGVPEELKKQTAQSTAALSSDYPPWPNASENHVHQKSDKAVWNQEELALNLKSHDEMNAKELPKLQVLKKTRVPNVDLSALLSYKEHGPIKDDILRLLLAEVASFNPSYPVKRVHKQLLAKKLDAEKQPEPATKPETDTTVKDDCQNPKKRKLQDANQELPHKGRKRKRGQQGSSPRRSRRMKLQDAADSDVAESDVEVIPIDSDESDKQDVFGNFKREMLWTDKYAPKCTSEVLGKANNIKKIHAWLENWKKVTDLEMRRMAKELEKQERKSRAKEQLSSKDKKEFSDESDFETDSCESDTDYDPDEDVTAGLCNTMLIQGPHGVGKTALVYALATQLGYKVFEVNASNKRAGRQVLQQLQEATQSHHVTNKNLTDVFSTILSGESLKPKEEKKEVKEKKKSATAAFNSLFGGKAKKASGEPQTEISPKNNSRKSRRKSSDDVQIVGEEHQQLRKVGVPNTPLFGQKPGNIQKKALDLSSCSLILFEEVDVVFEDDKGFWAAIQTFMNTTKRPIILTTTDRHFITSFDPKCEMRLEVLNLKFPKMLNTITYLQLVCLVENVRTDPKDIASLVEYHQGDIRQSLTALQFWAESGGSCQPIKKDITYRKSVLNKSSGVVTEDEGIGTGTTNSQETEPFIPNPAIKSLMADSADESSQTSEEEFDIPKTKSRRFPMRVVIEDDSSRESLPSTPSKRLNKINLSGTQSPSLARKRHLGTSEPSDVCVVPFEENTPVLHRGVFELQFNISGVPYEMVKPSMEPDLLKRLLSDNFDCTDILSKFRLQQIDLLWHNLLSVLPLPKKIVPLQTYTRFIDKTQAPQQRISRIKNRSDLFESDSEDEKEEFLTLKNKDEEKSKIADETSKMQEEEPTAQAKDVMDSEKAIDSESSAKKNKLKLHKVTSSNENAEASKNVKISQSDRVKLIGTKKVLSKDTKLLIQSLDSIASVSDMFSYCDSYLTLHDQSNSLMWTRDSFSQVELSCSNSEQPIIDHDEEPWKYRYSSDIISQVQCCSIRKTVNSFSAFHNTVCDLDPEKQKELIEKLTVPVECIGGHIKTTELSDVQQSLQQTYQKALDDVYNTVNPRSRRDFTSNNSATCSVSRHAVAVDYMPSLRLIGKSEQLREVAKTKRRFLHYFGANHINFKTSTLDTMNSSFL